MGGPLLDALLPALLAPLSPYPALTPVSSAHPQSSVTVTAPTPTVALPIHVPFPAPVGYDAVIPVFATVPTKTKLATPAVEPLAVRMSTELGEIELVLGTTGRMAEEVVEGGMTPPVATEVEEEVAIGGWLVWLLAAEMKNGPA